MTCAGHCLSANHKSAKWGLPKGRGVSLTWTHLGPFQVCLFGTNEVSLRDALRGGATDADIRVIINAALARKKAAHAGMFDLARTRNRAMVKIGG